MKKNVSWLCIILLSLLLLSSCGKTPKKLVSMEMEMLSVDSTLDGNVCAEYAAELQPYAEELSATMDAVIGYAPQALKAYAPESPLSNWAADVLCEASVAYIGGVADVGIVNLGGLRCEIPAGDVTLRKMYELMPFDNQLSIVWLSGADLDALCQGFAACGGQGVSGLSFCIQEGSVHDINVRGKPLDISALYSVAANDYLVAGNDGMTALTRYAKRVDTGVTIRDIYIDAVKKNTEQGLTWVAEVEGRLSFCSE